MFLKIMLGIVEVLSNVLVLISQVAALNWSHTIYSNLGYPRQKRRKSTFLHEKCPESTLSISDGLETYIENSWGPKQRFGINQPRKLRMPGMRIDRYYLRLRDESGVPRENVRESFYLIKNFATAHFSLFVIDVKNYTCKAIIFIRVSFID